MQLQEIAPANALLDDPAALARRYERDGCLLVRELLDPAIARRILAETTDVLRRWGLARLPGDPDCPRWNGQPVGARDTVELDSVPSVAALIDQFPDADASPRRAVDRVCGHDTYLWRGACFFAGFPDDPAYVTKPHRDGWGKGSRDSRRIWIAITPIEFGDGGLALALGSHRTGPLPSVEFPELRTRPDPHSVVPPEPVRGIDPALLPGEWHTAAMRPGDALVFSYDLVHRGIPFTSDRIRLALVAMASAMSGPRPAATYTKAETRARNQRIGELARGLSGSEIRRLVAHFYESPLDVTEATVQAAIRAGGSS